jgi:hypothetical protein
MDRNLDNRPSNQMVSFSPKPATSVQRKLNKNKQKRRKKKALEIQTLFLLKRRGFSQIKKLKDPLLSLSNLED